jgi:hypothetical protein
LFRQSQRKTRKLLLSGWFGACGLFATEHAIADLSVRNEFLQWKSAWHDLPKYQQVCRKYSQAFRPQNNLDRRLVVMFHHLNRLANEALL